MHPVPVAARRPDADYETHLREVLQWRQPGHDRLDFVLLGMGADGHTASLFPFNEALGETKRLVCGVTAPNADPPDRVTMTYPLINSARMIAVLVTGEGKAETVRRDSSLSIGSFF